MQYKVNAGASLAAIIKAANIAIDEVETGPLLNGNKSFHFVQVALMTGGKVVKADDRLIKFQQDFEKVGADEPRDASDELGSRLGRETDLDFFVFRH